MLTLLGFLILAAVVPTSLAEERVQGGLDVLVITPLTAREIMLGKWKANFRLALRLAFFPSLISFVAALILRSDDTSYGMVATVTTANGPVKEISIAEALQAGSAFVSRLPDRPSPRVPEIVTEIQIAAISAMGSGLSATSPARILQTYQPDPAAFEPTKALRAGTAEATFVAGASIIAVPGSTLPEEVTPTTTSYAPYYFSSPSFPVRLGISLLFLTWLAAWGALLVSTGLLIATVFKRPGWATTANVLLIVGVSFASLLLLPSTDPNAESWESPIFYLCPIIAPVGINLALGLYVEATAPLWQSALKGGAISTLSAAVLAYVLFQWSVRRLDKAMGRAGSDRKPRPAMRAPAVVPQQALAGP